MPDDKAKWLAGLEVGDLVIVRSSHINDEFGRLDNIARITPKQFIVGRASCYRHRREDGDRIGNSGSYHSAWIEEPTTERLTAIATDRRRSELRYKIRQVRWKDQSLATLEAVIEVLAKAGKD